METSAIIAILITTLIASLGFLIAGWIKSWETRIVAQDKRLDRHDGLHSNHEIKHATIVAELDNLKVTADETRKDVKELLRYANGNSSKRDSAGK